MKKIEPRIVTNIPEPANKNVGYLGFTPSTKDNVLAKYNSVNKFDGIQKSHKATADYSRGSGFDTINTRAPYFPESFYLQRMWQILPSRFRDVVYACRLIYLRLGIVRNVIDMITDFATEDMKLLHPDKKVEAFFKVWVEKVKLNDALDEFVRHLLIDGNVCVKRVTAKISKPVQEQWTEHTIGSGVPVNNVGKPSLGPNSLDKEGTDFTPEEEKVPSPDEPQKIYKDQKGLKREIPWQYNFLNVCALYWIGGDSARVTGKRQLAFKVADALANAIRAPQDVFQQMLYNELPMGIKENIKGGHNDLIPLDMKTVYVGHNKKDSWEDWAPPFMYSILADIQFRDKLRQAEISALDGVINVIRLWKLGDHKEGFLPSEGGIDKLIGILEANTGGGAIDIVWDSMIDMKDFYPPIDKILGSEKYEQVNKDIMVGLGIPEVLIGGEGGKFSNSYIQLKHFKEKLKYIREKLKDWLTPEINMVCTAMDIQVAPIISFNELSGDDENVHKKLIVGLLDRGVISVEAVLQAYGQDFLLEIERMKDEKKTFKTAKLEVIGPFDTIAPEKKNGSDTNNNNNNIQTQKPKGQPGEGRPPLTTNIGPTKRNPKPLRGQSKSHYLYALDAIDMIDEHVIPKYMDHIQISNARKLSTEQKDEINYIRVLVLSTLQPEDDLSEDRLLEISENTSKADTKLIKFVEDSISEFIQEKSKEPTLVQRKRIEAIAWAAYHEVEDQLIEQGVLNA